MYVSCCCCHWECTLKSKHPSSMYWILCLLLPIFLRLQPDIVQTSGAPKNVDYVPGQSHSIFITLWSFVANNGHERSTKNTDLCIFLPGTGTVGVASWMVISSLAWDSLWTTSVPTGSDDITKLDYLNSGRQYTYTYMKLQRDILNDLGR